MFHSFCSNITFNKFDPFMLFNSTDHSCYNFIMMEATKSGKDFNEWCFLWLIKIDLIFSVDKIVEYLLLAQLDSFNSCLVKVDYAPSLMARIILERFLQEHEETPRELPFFLFSNGTLLLPSPNLKIIYTAFQVT